VSESPAEPPGAELPEPPGAELPEAPGAELPEAPGAELPEATAEQLVEELQKVKVSDLLVHTSSLLASLAFGKLAPDVRDLEQARLAIDALKALGPLLDEGPRRDIQQVVANLQLAYVEAAAPSAET
jgi:ribosomal protein L12E/L44/L45/RPP1/RPP2